MYDILIKNAKIADGSGNPTFFADVAVKDGKIARVCKNLKAEAETVIDGKGKVQIYVSRDSLGEESYASFKKWDIGDIIGVKGTVFKTKTGETSVHASEMTLSLKPLPEKFHGLTDTELRYRQRYVDLIVNPEVKDTFAKRSKIRALSSEPPSTRRWKCWISTKTLLRTSATRRSSRKRRR